MVKTRLLAAVEVARVRACNDAIKCGEGSQRASPSERDSPANPWSNINKS